MTPKQAWFRLGKGAEIFCDEYLSGIPRNSQPVVITDISCNGGLEVVGRCGTPLRISPDWDVTASSQMGGPVGPPIRHCVTCNFIHPADQVCSSSQWNYSVISEGGFIVSRVPQILNALPKACTCDFSGPNCWLGCRCGAIGGERA